MENYNPFALVGKTILVTGASSGIGKAVAIECSKMGAIIIVTGRNKDRLDETYNLLIGSGHSQISADLSNEEELLMLVESLPVLHGLVHCAGLIMTLPAQFINRKALSSIMEVNFTAPTLISAMLVKNKKIVRNGSIVFISSISGQYCTATANSMYSASKGAVDGIAKGMALDFSPKGIRVNTVNPGLIETQIFSSGIITDDQLNIGKKDYPLKRYGKPEEVAYAVIYLLSDASVWVTGTNLVIDGGFTLQ